MDRKLPDMMQKTGTLILVFGPSGSGKDTLIDAAKARFINDNKVHFPKRIITRGDTTGEDHTPVSLSDFRNLQEDNKLFLQWEAHGLQYGVPSTVLDKLNEGCIVILNISRRLVAGAREKWENTKLIQVFVQDDILFERLKNRGRESEEAINARFARRAEPTPDGVDHIVDNSYEQDIAERDFLAIVSSCL